MGIARALQKTLLFPGFGTSSAFGNFWPQDWNGTAGLRQTPNVDANSAMGVAAYYAGIRVLSESVAMLPLLTYRRLPGGGKERATDHPLYPILHDRANPEMTAFTWRETSMGHLVAYGNSFSEIQRDGRGRVVALWPLRPDRMSVIREDGKIIYRYRVPYPDQTGTYVVDLPRERVLHMHGLGFDGLIGYSPIDLMRRSIGLAISAEEYGQRTFDNDARPGVYLSHPGRLSSDAQDRLEARWNAQHGGLSNAQRAAVLEEGISVHEIGVPPIEAQYIDARKMQRSDIATALRLPPHTIGDLEHATFTNIEVQGIELVIYSFGPWFVRIEQQIGMDLIPEPDIFTEHLVDGFLRGDAMARAQSLWIQRQAGVINADEWREIENRNPLPNGDGQVYLQPLNMTPVGSPPPGATPDQVKPQPGQPNPLTDTVPVMPVQPSQNGKFFENGKVWEGLDGIGVPINDLKCKGCGRLVAETVTPPYNLGPCRHCKTVNSVEMAAAVPAV